MWKWLEKVKTFVQTIGKKLLGKGATHALVDATIDIATGYSSKVTTSLIEGAMSLGQWQKVFRQEIKDVYIQQYILGRGGKDKLIPTDYRSIGGMLKEQYKYLDGFADDIAAGNLTPGQIQMRGDMYINSAREGFYRGRGRAYGIPEGALPVYPGQGKSQCLCLTDPEIRILTIDGYKTWNEIKVGDLVKTHLGNYKPIISKIMKPSHPEHKQVYIFAPSGRWVGCTDTHEWLTPSGWADAIYIVNTLSFCYIDLDRLDSQSAIIDQDGAREITCPTKTFKPEIIIGDYLPVRTVLYDIWVDDDHSYIAEGLISKNTNCRCRWEIEEVFDNDLFTGWNCTWVVIRDKESCQDCIEYGEEYKPLFIPYIPPETEG